MAKLADAPDSGNRLHRFHNVAFHDLPKYLAGNYFFLRRNVPIRDITAAELDQFANDPAWKAAGLNYVIAEPARLSQSLMSRLEVVQTFGTWRVFRLRVLHEPRL